MRLKPQLDPPMPAGRHVAYVCYARGPGQPRCLFLGTSQGLDCFCQTRVLVTLAICDHFREWVGTVQPIYSRYLTDCTDTVNPTARHPELCLASAN
jgi:hypothetical protein